LNSNLTHPLEWPTQWPSTEYPWYTQSDFYYSERSDECIDFTMMCVFFYVSVYSITNRNNASISNFGGGFW